MVLVSSHNCARAASYPFQSTLLYGRVVLGHRLWSDTLELGCASFISNSLLFDVSVADVSDFSLSWCTVQPFSPVMVR